jgi:hypothetical protein
MLTVSPLAATAESSGAHTATNTLTGVAMLV